MKKKWMLICFTVILILLVACNKKEATTKQSSIEKQIQVIAEQIGVWKGEEKDIYYGYAVTDLDQNGRLEIIASTCQGSGIFTYSSFYIVNENGDGLVVYEYPGANEESEADIMEDSVDVYYDSDENIYYYTFSDYIRCGSAEMHNNLRAIFLQNKKVNEFFISSSELRFTEDNMVEKYYDAEGNLVSEEVYYTLENQAFEDLKEKQATIHWESYEGIELLSLKEKDLYDMLEKSFLGFSVK